jgi:hypothetical protein
LRAYWLHRRRCTDTRNLRPSQSLSSGLPRENRASRSGTRMTCVGPQAPLVLFGVTATAGKSRGFVRV